jgi:hypothetical protein
MPPRKPYNPNTKYGRKKLREQAEEYRQSLPEDQRKDFSATGVIVLIIIIDIVLIIALATGNGKGAANWLTR